MPNFSHVIRDAYLDILQRMPDPGGLETYNAAMNQGLTLEELRERLLRSPEYASRFPERPPVASAEASRHGARSAAARPRRKAPRASAASSGARKPRRTAGTR